ncbi:hypothetical protein BJF96_g3352 [Verticillium dahliae]|uniref:Uncharacterized protein n=1 Tax=Verticillium dahliae TaxID=27337 RepID=A0AA44WM16_VERDA|nr:hypothetical protein BJF96_g3352 [Verticillium dahliae]
MTPVPHDWRLFLDLNQVRASLPNWYLDSPKILDAATST